MKVVVITGSRHWTALAPIEAVLHGAELLIVGDCPPDPLKKSSADSLALWLARRAGVPVIVYAASPSRAEFLRARGVKVRVASDWNRESRRAGPTRNHAIVCAAVSARESGFDVHCEAFPLPDSVGTYDCIRQLRAAGFAVRIHRAPSESGSSEAQTEEDAKAPTMPALTLIQPWAYAIARLGKGVENRTWTPPRHALGRRIAIHAGKKCNTANVHALQAHGYAVPDSLVSSAVVATAFLAGWVRDPSRFSPSLTRAEAELVLRSPWYIEGSVGWVLRDVRAIEPIACKGARGLWELSPTLSRTLLPAAASPTSSAQAPSP